MPTPAQRWADWRSDARTLRVLEAELWSRTPDQAKLAGRTAPHLPPSQLDYLRVQAKRLKVELSTATPRLDSIRVEYLYSVLGQVVESLSSNDLPEDPWFYYRAVLAWKRCPPALRWIPGRAPLNFLETDIKISAALLDARRHATTAMEAMRDERGLLSIDMLLKRFDRRLMLYMAVNRQFQIMFETPSLSARGTGIIDRGKVWSNVSFDGLVFHNADGWSPMWLDTWLPANLSTAIDATDAVKSACVRRGIGVLTPVGSMAHSLDSVLVRMAFDRHLSVRPAPSSAAKLLDAFTASLCGAGGRGASAVHALMALGRHVLASRAGFVATPAEVERFINQTVKPLFNAQSVNQGFARYHLTPARWLEQTMREARGDSYAVFATLADEASQDDEVFVSGLDGLAGLGPLSQWLRQQVRATNAVRACARQALVAPWHRDVLISSNAVAGRRNLVIYGFYAWYAQVCSLPLPFEEWRSARAALQRLGVTDAQLAQTRTFTLFEDTASPRGQRRRGTLLDEFIWRMRAHDLRSADMLLPATAQRGPLSIRPQKERQIQRRVYAQAFVTHMCAIAKAAEAVRKAHEPPSDFSMREAVRAALRLQMPADVHRMIDQGALVVPGLGAAWVLYQGVKRQDAITIETGAWNLLMSLLPLLPGDTLVGGAAELETEGAGLASVASEEDLIGSTEDLALAAAYRRGPVGATTRRGSISVQGLFKEAEEADLVFGENAHLSRIPPRFRGLADVVRRGSDISYFSDRLAVIEGEDVTRLRRVQSDLFAEIDWEGGWPVQGVPMVEFARPQSVYRRMDLKTSASGGASTSSAGTSSHGAEALDRLMPFIRLMPPDKARATQVLSRSFSMDIRERYPEIWKGLSLAVDQSAEVTTILNAFDERFFAASQYPSVIEHVLVPFISQLVAKTRTQQGDMPEMTLSAEGFRALLFEERLLESVINMMDGMVGGDGRTTVERTTATALVDRAIFSLGLDVSPRISSWIFQNSTLEPLWKNPQLTTAQRELLAAEAREQDLWLDKQLAPSLPPVRASDRVLGEPLGKRLTVRGALEAYRLIDEMPSRTDAAVSSQSDWHRYVSVELNDDWARMLKSALAHSPLLQTAFRYWLAQQPEPRPWHIFVYSAEVKAAEGIAWHGYFVDDKFLNIEVYDDQCRYAAARGLRTMDPWRKLTLALFEAFLGQSEELARLQNADLQALPDGSTNRGWPVVLAEAALREMGETVHPQVAARLLGSQDEHASRMVALLTQARRAAEKEDELLNFARRAVTRSRTP